MSNLPYLYRYFIEIRDTNDEEEFITDIRQYFMAEKLNLDDVKVHDDELCPHCDGLIDMPCLKDMNRTLWYNANPNTIYIYKGACVYYSQVISV